MDKWKKQEKKDAKDFDGKRTLRSGGIWFMPGDVKTEEYLIENKTTDNKSYSLKALVWKKIHKEAIKEGRKPLMLIQIQDVELVVLDRNDFLEMINE